MSDSTPQPQQITAIKTPLPSKSCSKPLSISKDDSSSTEPDTKPKDKPLRKASPTSHLYAGFASGITSSILLQPLDLLKTRVQQSGEATITSAFKELTSFRALWRGTVPSALRMSIGSGLYFTTLNSTRAYLQQRNYNKLLQDHDKDTTSKAGNAGLGDSSSLPKLGMYENLASGAFVRGVVGFMTMPITVIKVRYESSMYNYTSMWNAVQSVYRNHGVRGYFYGYGATFARDAPYAGLYVLFYEKSKEIVNNLFPSTERRSTVTAAIMNSSSAFFSAGLATTITSPFDTIKTRVQLNPVKYKGFFQAAKIMVKEDGFIRFFDGLSLRLSRKALSAGISWCIYEEIVRRLQQPL
ncbi:hypothetical protein AWJ20_9 [Sugiyamaella lignohabitans]|uniref:Mitochondrial glycine transporter n=1 Tax=Sugiyamaella lignohabitans TaxID=796027 RepID=A0A167CJQ6_9ASCO|nr:uncharacterized protein AWJ20_9 [Sugiyamaella lignohabitans]ANB11789.1 hypothetical protein AWJ20_9 [Sugiyamaella lignohabitans]